MFGWVMAVATATGLLAIGVGALVAPRMAAGQYGIVLDDPRALAFIRAMGVRDVMLGIVLGIVVRAGDPVAVGWAMLSAALVAAVDYVLVSMDAPVAPGSAANARRRARVLHGGSAVALLTATVLLFAGR